MSTAALTGLLDYLYDTLSPANMIWLAAQLTEYADRQEQSQSLEPYTIEELHERIAQSERDIAEGRLHDFDDAMREIEEELACREKHEMAEAV